MSSSTTHHRLTGLEPDNLLAFMALLGLLRALDTARPEWCARAYWDVARLPLRPVLVVPAAVTQDAVAAAAAAGMATLAAAHQFDRDDLNHSQEEAQRLLDEAEGLAAEVLDALMSDGAMRDKGGIWPTPFCFLFGQGHQHFLSRLRDVPRGVLPARLAKGRKAPNLTEPRFIHETLFAPWQRAELTDGFRWDPIEDRRYALRADDPSGDPAGMQHGANVLAAVGLPALAGATIVRRGESRFLNVGTHYGREGGISFTWPVWTAPARLSGIRALLAHPDMAGERAVSERLAAVGVTQVFRARRVSVGKFFNVTRAEQVD